MSICLNLRLLHHWLWWAAIIHMFVSILYWCVNLLKAGGISACIAALSAWHVETS